jgi:hypothetical protein
MGTDAPNRFIMLVRGTNLAEVPAELNSIWKRPGPAAAVIEAARPDGPGSRELGGAMQPANRRPPLVGTHDFLL